MKIVQHKTHTGNNCVKKEKNIFAQRTSKKKKKKHLTRVATDENKK